MNSQEGIKMNEQLFTTIANSGSIRTPIPETFGQVFLNYSDTHSGIIRAVIPETSGH